MSDILIYNILPLEKILHKGKKCIFVERFYTSFIEYFKAVKMQSPKSRENFITRKLYYNDKLRNNLFTNPSPSETNVILFLVVTYVSTL